MVITNCLPFRVSASHMSCKPFQVYTQEVKMSDLYTEKSETKPMRKLNAGIKSESLNFIQQNFHFLDSLFLILNVLIVFNAIFIFCHQVSKSVLNSKKDCIT